MLQAIRRKMDDDKGFTLIELMVVVLIIAILIAIAIPTFLGLRERAQDRAAQSDLRNGLTAAKAFFTDADTYTGFTAAAGQAIEPSLNWVGGQPAAATDQVGVANVTADQVALVRHSQSDKTFCIADDVGVGTVRGVLAAGGAIADYAACDGLPDW